MNFKLYFNLVFMIAGTFVLAAVIIIAGMNFVKDGRLFEKPVVVAVQDTSSKISDVKPGTQPVETPDEYKTFKYTRAADAYGDATDYGEAVPATKKLRVEVINYTGVKKLGQEIKTTLEGAGFEVSVTEEKKSKSVSTAIIDRNDKKAGAKVQKLLKVGQIVKWADTKSKFDVTLKVGNDYLP